MLSCEHQIAWRSKITKNDGLTRSGIGCF